MHQQFNIQQMYTLPTLYLCVFIDLRTNSDLCHLQHKLIGFYNRDEKFLQRGTDWVFKKRSLFFSSKGLILVVILWRSFNFVNCDFEDKQTYTKHTSIPKSAYIAEN